MARLVGCVATAVTSTILLVESARAYNSEEHKMLVDRGASMVLIDPSIQFPARTGMFTTSRTLRRNVFTDTKYFAVGVRNNSGQHITTIKELQDNSYWTGWEQAEGNKKIYIPDSTELYQTTLEVLGHTGGTAAASFTIGELASIYGDYRRTVYCNVGKCFLTNADASNLGFANGTDCFACATCPPTFQDCGWRPPDMSQARYLRYIASGLWPPYSANSSPDADGPDDLDEAAWWGDEMLRIATSNDWHFSSAAAAWYVGCHRLALYYAGLARANPDYWNQALHYEAHGLHSLTDLFAFGHVVTNADQRSYGIVNNADSLNSRAIGWMNNVLRIAGASKEGATDDEPGRVILGTNLPAITEYSARVRRDYLPLSGTSGCPGPNCWGTYAVQEKDFHDCYNASSGTVRNLDGELFKIFGDGDIEKTAESTRAIIAEAVRASLQSLFDGYVELGRGRTPEQVAAAGSSYFAALRKIPVFVVSNPEHYHDGYFDNVTTGNNYNGRWTLYAEYLDVLTGANIVPNGTPCVIRYEWGANYIEPLQSPGDSCTSFPAIAPRAGGPAQIHLDQSFPNPFATNANIRFTLSRSAHVAIEIFDITGGKIRTLLREQRSPGNHFATWDATNDAGKRVRAGLYFYRLSIEGQTLTRAMTFVP